MRDEGFDEAIDNPDHVGGIRTAVLVWFEDPAAAKAKYGPIASWETSEITNMRWLFEDKEDFNEDISRWEVGRVWGRPGGRRGAPIAAVGAIGARSAAGVFRTGTTVVTVEIVCVHARVVAARPRWPDAAVELHTPGRRAAVASEVGAAWVGAASGRRCLPAACEHDAAGGWAAVSREMGALRVRAARHLGMRRRRRRARRRRHSGRQG